MEITVTINGTQQTHDVEPRTLLVHAIRDELGLTGTNIGCDSSSCGSCTVLVDGRSAKSCTMFAVQADGADIMTIEGLAGDGDGLHPMQQAFHECHGLQCGYCTSGMILGAYGLLLQNPTPTHDEIVEHMDDHLCRCAGYRRILAAIEAASRVMGETGS